MVNTICHSFHPRLSRPLTEKNLINLNSLILYLKIFLVKSTTSSCSTHAVRSLISWVHVMNFPLNECNENFFFQLQVASESVCSEKRGKNVEWQKHFIHSLTLCVPQLCSCVYIIYVDMVKLQRKMKLRKMWGSLLFW